MRLMRPISQLVTMVRRSSRELAVDLRKMMKEISITSEKRLLGCRDETLLLVDTDGNQTGTN